MIIGISGKKYSGKDTVANYLIGKYKFKKYSFADPIKDICKIMFDFDEDELYGNKKECLNNKWNIVPRNAFQVIGTDFGQNILHQLFPEINCDKKNFWVYKALDYCEKNKEENIVIPDFRFNHEIKMFKSKFNSKFQIWNIKRNNEMFDDHISENELNNYQEYDFCIYNDKTIQELYTVINDKVNINI